MTNAIDNAAIRLQELAKACTTVTVKSAPTYPIENAEPCPFTVAYLSTMRAITESSGMIRIIPVMSVDAYFSPVIMSQAYRQMYLFAYEFAQRLGGDPTLDGAISTVVFSDEVTGENLGLGKWGSVDMLLWRFTIPIKINGVTTTTST